MEKSRLPSELQTIADRVTKFRNEYSNLKTHYAAQEELIDLQKLELEKFHLRVDQLASALVDYHKRFTSTLRHLEFENRRLQKVIDNNRSEFEKSRDNGNEFVREFQRNNDDYVRRLEEDSDAMRMKIVSQEEKHREQIKTIEKRYGDEITIYEEKLERANSLEQRLRHEIDAHKKKLENIIPQLLNCNAKITRRGKNCANGTLHGTIAKEKYSHCSHPALSNVMVTTGDKRKRNVPASYRWPQLDISIKKEDASTQELTENKKKKLYSADNDTIVDLTS